MPNRADITPELLRQLFLYDPETGLLAWKKNPSKEALKTVDNRGYKVGGVLGMHFQAHRVVWAMHYGEWPNKIDHINGDRLDNRIVNLRNVDFRENARNRQLSSSNKSGHYGVVWLPDLNKWRAMIGVDKKRISLGLYEKKEDAISARADANKKYGFHPNHGRNPHNPRSE